MCDMGAFDNIFCLCRMVFEKVLGFRCLFLKKCHYGSEGDRYDSPGKGLAVKLMQIEKSVQTYEAGTAAVAGRRKAKKGWKW